MKIYTMKGELSEIGMEKLIEDLASSMVLNTCLKRDLMTKFYLSERAYNYVIYAFDYNRLKQHYCLVLKKNLLTNRENVEDVERCYNGNMIELLYQYNKEVFNNLIEEIKRVLRLK